jgi:hypothetical protein
VVARGISINGLPITLKGDSTTGSIDMNHYYRDCVIGGPGAFILPVRDISEMARTIEHKLLREILVAGVLSRQPPLRQIAVRSTTATAVCNLGPGAVR